MKIVGMGIRERSELCTYKKLVSILLLSEDDGKFDIE